MEEILASIRRIISEDEDETRAGQPSAAAPRPRQVQAQPVQLAPTVQTAPRAPQPEPQFVARPAEAAQRAPQPSRPQPQPQPQPASRAVPPAQPVQPAAPQAVTPQPVTPQKVTMSQPEPSEQILSETAVAAASKAFQSLTQKVKVSTKGEGRSLEEIVSEMLRPMIKDWLDSHLPAIVEEKVEAEVKRLARQGS